MSNDVSITVKVKKSFGKEEFEDLLKTIDKGNFKKNEIEEEVPPKSFRHSFHYTFHPPKSDMSISIFWVPERGIIHTGSSALYTPIEITKDVAKRMFLKLNTPTFGYDAFSIQEEFEEIGETKFRKERIFGLTILTSEEVKKIGEEKVMGSPCEIIEPLENKGILLMIHKDSCSSSFEEREKLRNHLTHE